MTDRQIELERRFGEAGTGPVRFPPGEEILLSTPFVRELLAGVGEMTAAGARGALPGRAVGGPGYKADAG